MNYLQVQTTVETEADAHRIAEKLVERKLAACVQVIGPIKSSYWWQGKTEHAEEFLCLIKTDEQRYPSLEALLSDIHPYEVPEIIALPVIHGGQLYLDWVTDTMSR